MKTISLQNLPLLAVALLALPAQAIEAPSDEAAPPSVAGQPQAGAAPAAEPKKEIAYLGVVTGPIPELLTTHLGVRNGEGVLVRSVMPEGPAETAGINAQDLIITIDGKAALSPKEISEIIRSHQPGDKVVVGLIQRGKGTELNVTLGSRPDRMARHEGRRAPQVHGMPDEMAERIRDMIEGNMMEFQFDGDALNLGDGQPEVQRMMKEMQERMQRHRKLRNRNPGEAAPMQFQNNTTIRVMDGEGSIEITSNDGDRTLIARDKDNEILWQGPWNNDKDKAAAPEGIRERAGHLNFGMDGLKLKLPGR